MIFLIKCSTVHRLKNSRDISIFSLKVDCEESSFFFKESKERVKNREWREDRGGISSSFIA